jgi:hypothetical protein
MKTTLQFFKDMGVCDGAYGVLARVFGQAGVTEFDYAQGYEVMLGMMGQLEVEAAQSGEPGHDTAQGWLQWCFDLRNRPEAIMYFGDHIEENLFRTNDGQVHESLQAAQDYDRRRYAELKADHGAGRVINGVRIGEGDLETWEVLDAKQDNLTSFDAFIWHDSTTGLNHRTSNVAEALAFNAEQAKILDAIDAAEAAAGIERRIRDESGEFGVWVFTEKLRKNCLNEMAGERR